MDDIHEPDRFKFLVRGVLKVAGAPFAAILLYSIVRMAM
jgi:hypothetical protein